MLYWRRSTTDLAGAIVSVDSYNLLHPMRLRGIAAKGAHTCPYCL